MKHWEKSKILKTDIERIKQIREAIGPHIPLRLDANQGWNFETAVIVLQALSGYNIQFCEEPIPRWDYMRLKALQNKSPVPLMADESCFDHHDARRLIDLGAVGLFNLKLGKSSGILKATKMIKLAEKAGIKMQTGGFLESRLAFTAAAHLALSSQLIHYYDFDTPLMLEQDPVNGGIIYEKGGIIAVPKQPGLGAVPDPDYLKNLPQKIYSH